MENKNTSIAASSRDSSEERDLFADWVPSKKEAQKDIDVMLWSLRLHEIRRYYKQRFWREESREAKYAERVEGSFGLESVSEHSWHVADTALLVVDHFTYLDRNRCIEMAVLHDKLEILMGDKNPVGRDGTGNNTHAFDAKARIDKKKDEKYALEKYSNKLRDSIRDHQSAILEELINGKSREARFVKAVDKLQALGYVVKKKNGGFEDKHIIFTLRYSSKSVEYFPGLINHYRDLRRRMIRDIAEKRDVKKEELANVLKSKQLDLKFPES